MLKPVLNSGTVLFTKATDKELEIIEKAWNRGNKPEIFTPMETCYIKQGNFLVCLLRHGEDCGVLVGVCKRNPKVDEENLLRAQTIALSRAVKNQTSVRFLTNWVKCVYHI